MQAAQTDSVPERSGSQTEFASLANKSVKLGSTLTGRVYSGSTETHTFSVNKRGEFSFKPVDGNSANPIAARCRLKRTRGIIVIEWETPPPDQSLVVDYIHIDYTNGWSTLFIAIGVLYLISSLCWLFIDCTIPLDPEDTVE